MIYSSVARGVFATAKSLFSTIRVTSGSSSPSVLSPRRIETSDPKEINEAFIRAELDVGSGEGDDVASAKTKAPRLKWASTVEEAIRELGASDGSRAVVIVSNNMYALCH